jgi:hypothetical protein
MSDNSLNVRIEPDLKSFARVVAALRAEADGKQLRKDFVREMRMVAQPALSAARAAILSMDSHSEVVPGLRATIARKTTVSVRTTGKRQGVSIRTSKSGMPRGFENAPRNTNRPFWRHKVFGNPEKWVTQVGKPQWFDGSVRPFLPAARRGAKEALEAVARRIDERSKG